MEATHTTDVFFLRRDERYKLFDLLLPEDEGAMAVVGLAAEPARLLDPTASQNEYNCYHLFWFGRAIA